jgi:hypothetical protein
MLIGARQLTGPRSVHFTNNMRHAGLVANKGRKMNWLVLVIFGESLALAPMPPAPLLGQEPFGAVPRRREFTVRLQVLQNIIIAHKEQLPTKYTHTYIAKALCICLLTSWLQ